VSGDRRSGGHAVAERPVARPPVDPRLRARRIEVRRSEGRRRLRRILVAVAVTVVCLIAWGITRSPLLDVDHLEVHGVDRLGAARVIEVAGIERGDALVDLDLGDVRRSIEALAWVDTARVERSWSGTIGYRVVERTPRAVLVGSGSGAWLVDAQGWVLAPATPADVDELPGIEGVPVPDEGGQVDAAHREAIDLAGALTVGLRPWVNAVVVDEAGEHWLRLERSATDPRVDHDPDNPPVGPIAEPAMARLGHSRDRSHQLVAVETVLTRVDLACLATLDARVPSAPVVLRHPSCEAE
jgi:hypothetical protein